MKPVMTILIDFDDTIHNRGDVSKGYKMGKPFPDAKEALEAFKLMGYKIVVFSVKALTASGELAIKDWLNYFKIPFDKVTCVKEAADFFIDDKAVRFNGNWKETFGTIKNLTRVK